MKNLKSSDLRAKSLDELRTMALEEKAALFVTRRDLVFRKTTDLAGKKTRRHNIARIMTMITEKEKANG